ncbi:MAG: hypothetical protein R2710_06050 [Acidimicrobiales bacterium]
MSATLEARDMFSLMPGGRERQEQLLADYATPDLQSGLAEPYHEFLTLNDEFKQLHRVADARRPTQRTMPMPSTTRRASIVCRTSPSGPLP